MNGAALRVSNRLLRGFTHEEARALEVFLRRMLENAQRDA
jgi:hypothetical protein